MLKNNRIIIGLIVAFIIIPIIALTFLFPKKEGLTPPGTNIPIASITPRVSIIAGQGAAIVNVFPENNTSQVFLPIQQVKLTLSEYVSAEGFVVEVSPLVNIKQGNDPSDPFTIILSPDPVWKPGITTIKIRKTGASGTQILTEDFNFKINTSYPKNPDDVY